MLCDVKNHLIREANLHTKTVRHISGVQGVRGSDLRGGMVPAAEQALASPWDLVKSPSGEYIVAMAGTHQIWQLDTRSNICKVFSGNGGEGNQNSKPQYSTWAQPSGITLGPIDGDLSFFIADSESSAIRGISFDTEKAFNVAGANDNVRDLFDFGDEEGKGYQAKLQHPLGVHYCAPNKTLYVADTYNHKIKIMKQGDGQNELLKTTRLTNWIGSSKDNVHLKDAQLGQARLNEPNGCWARVGEDGAFKGLYIADTGNSCVRFAHPDGTVQTLELRGIPDVRSTNPADCGDC